MDLKEFVGKKHITLTSRGNKAIKLAFEYAKSIGHTVLCIPDQGGWITYRQYGNKLKFEVVEIATSDGAMDYSLVPDSCCLVVNSLPGYAVDQSNIELSELHARGIFVILDIAGVIGMDNDCDIMVGSFGKHKPINAFYGGFIATDLDVEFESDYDMSNFEDLQKHLDNLGDRIEFLAEKRSQIIEKLETFKIVRPDDAGINVLVEFDSEEEKEKIVSIVESEGFEWTLCPRYIRLMRDAISVEVKRLSEDD